MDARIQLWDATTGKKLREIPAHKYCVNSLDFSPDGKTLASTGWQDKSIRLWDADTGRKLLEIPCDYSNGVVKFSPDGRVLAWSNGMTGDINLWEMASKKLRQKFHGHTTAVHSLAFSADGKTLVSGSMDTTGLVWDVTGMRTNVAPALSEKKLASHWKTLASLDTATAGQAVWALNADPQLAVGFLSARLRELPKPDPQQMPRLVADLDSQSFETRESAEKKLKALGKLAVPALNEASARKVSLEASRRIEALLENREAAIQSPEALQILRALEVLEHIGTPAARDALEFFANQTSDSYFRQEARAASARLGRQPARATGN